MTVIFNRAGRNTVADDVLSSTVGVVEVNSSSFTAFVSRGASAATVARDRRYLKALAIEALFIGGQAAKTAPRFPLK